MIDALKTVETFVLSMMTIGVAGIQLPCVTFQPIVSPLCVAS